MNITVAFVPILREDKIAGLRHITRDLVLRHISRLMVALEMVGKSLPLNGSFKATFKL